ncbi:hypothetical protein [Thiothrix lacustris]|uniref:hypothetical protein n=1 Tax=Thiothrix lacustris TaxID=525917 RepID=UPI00049178DF|nr:hypothetical protein [Thiothrix lacustris]
MSDKQKFVRSTAALFVACHHEKPDAGRAIQWAASLWKKLTEAGYGDKQGESKPRSPEADYCQQMSERQRKLFDQFWGAFNHKQGRNGAAMRWLQLGECKDDEYRQIISAAKAEAAKPMQPGQVRKMAQGWLTERRWLDHLEAPSAGVTSPASKRAEEYRALIGELDHAKRTITVYKPDEEGHEYWQSQITKLTASIEQLRSN